MPPPTLAKKGKKMNSNFMAQLDAKLGGQTRNTNVVIANNSAPRKPNANLEQLMTSKNGGSPSRGSLLSPIHGGVQLRRTEHVSD